MHMPNLKNSHKYDDIINLPHPTSKNHPRMKNIERAAQFSPFAALTGYDSAIKETARITETHIELDENEKARLNCQIRLLLEKLPTNPFVAITYYVPDSRKDGGAYQTVSGNIKKLIPVSASSYYVMKRRYQLMKLFSLKVTCLMQAMITTYNLYTIKR